ncbi:unnamed protein product [Brassica oleracea]
MAGSFSFPLRITKNHHLENLYKMHGIDRAIELGLASTFETPDKSTAGLISFFKDCGLTFPIPEPVLSRHLALEYDATPSARPSSSGRLDRRMSRTSSFQISRLTQGSGTVENSPLVPIPDSEEKGISAAKKSHVSLSSGSQDDFVAPRRKRHRSTKAVTSKPSQVEVGTRGLNRWKFAHEGDGPLSITRDYLVRLVRCTRPQGFRPLSLAVSEEKKVYAKLATANSKVMEALQRR